jgi:hypothetical protein
MAGLLIPEAAPVPQAVPVQTSLLQEAEQAPAYEHVRQLLQDKGLSKNTIAGILANIHVETGGSFDFKTKQRGGKGYGLFQFDFMKPHYDKWLKDTEREDSSSSQIDFMYDSIYKGIKVGDADLLGEGHRAELVKSFENGNPADVTHQFQERFERPGKPHALRRQRAALFYATLGQDHPDRQSLLN